MTFIDSSETVKQSMRALLRDENLDASPGSAIDGTVVHAAAEVLDTVYTDVDSAIARVQIGQIASGTIAVDGGFLDDYMAAFGLTRNAAVLANGYVDFMSTDARSRVIDAGYRVRYGSYTYEVLNRTEVVPRSAGGVESNTRVFIQPASDPISGAAYRFRIPVTAVDEGPEPLLTTGDELTAPTTLPAVARIVAAGSFVGGTTAETNQEFAARAIEGLVPANLCGEIAASNLADSLYPGASVSLVGPGNPLMLRRADNLFGLACGGYVDAYVKSGAPTKTVVQAEAVFQAGRQFTITLTAAKALAGYRFNVVSYPQTPLSGAFTGAISVDSISYALDTTGGATTEVSAEEDLRYSTSASVTITFTDTRAYVSGGAPVVAASDTSVDYGVEITYMPGVTEVASAIHSGDYNPGGADYLVKAAIPVYVEVDVGVTIPSGYAGPDENTLAGVVAAYINRLPISAEELGIFEVSNAVAEVAPTASVVSVLAYGSVLGASGVSYTISPTGQKLVIPTIPAERLGPETSFFTTTRSQVTVTFV